jgi:hypothetical protein
LARGLALFPGSVAYIWHAGTKAGIVQDSLAACGFETRSQIIWAKNNFAIGRGHYHCKHEPCWVRGALRASSRTPQLADAPPARLDRRRGRARAASRRPPRLDPPGLNNSAAAALSVSQAHYLIDKLFCVCGCIGVVLLIGAQCVMFRKYFL